MNHLDVIRRHSLIEEPRLRQAVAQFEQSHPTPDGHAAAADPSADKDDAWGEFLVGQGLLTAWQLRRLRDGDEQQLVLGKYNILGRLGSGAMSTVFLAEHRLMRRRVAIKVLPAERVRDSSYLGRFYVESQAIAALDHPNIVRAFDVDNEGTLHYIVMEYVPGRDLQQIVACDGPLNPALAADYIRQAAMGLDHAHTRNLVHRDIKPANLLCDCGGTIKILDMGLARITTNSESLTLLHKESLLGTTDYIAPEQARDSHGADHRADLYSLGCTLYFLLTGRPPFPEGTLTERLLKHQREEPAPIEELRPDAPPRLVALCRWMMAKDKVKRPASAGEIADLLEKWLFDQGIKPPKRRRRGTDWNLLGLGLASLPSGQPIPPHCATPPSPAVPQHTPLVELFKNIQADPATHSWLRRSERVSAALQPQVVGSGPGTETSSATIIRPRAEAASTSTRVVTSIEQGPGVSATAATMVRHPSRPRPATRPAPTRAQTTRHTNETPAASKPTPEPAPTLPRVEEEPVSISCQRFTRNTFWGVPIRTWVILALGSAIALTFVLYIIAQGLGPASRLGTSASSWRAPHDGGPSLTGRRPCSRQQAERPTEPKGRRRSR